MKNECLICGEPLEYLNEDVETECEICHKKENSKTRCVKGHYVCSECHMKGSDSIISVCLSETSRSPVEILDKCMSMPFCHMHGRLGIDNSLCQLRRKYRSRNISQGNVQKRQLCSRRCMWFLGSLRRRYQRRNVRFHSDRLHTAGYR